MQQPLMKVAYDSDTKTIRIDLEDAIKNDLSKDDLEELKAITEKTVNILRKYI